MLVRVYDSGGRGKRGICAFKRVSSLSRKPRRYSAIKRVFAVRDGGGSDSTIVGVRAEIRVGAVRWERICNVFECRCRNYLIG